MNEQDKQLLLADLCARLPYGVIGEYSWKGRESYNRELTGTLYDELKSSWNSTGDSEFFPYLRPMSSMTEEEKQRYNQFIYHLEAYSLPNYGGYFVFVDEMHELQDWLNRNHFDYRGLIPKGLAIEVTEDNNPYKE